MRFKFCGDSDCPDWVLAHFATLAKLTSIKLRLMTAEIISSIMTDHIKVDKLEKLTSDAKLDSLDVKCAVAALNFIIASAAKYQTATEVLSDELQQLGLPKEHANSVCRTYADKFDSLTQVLRSKSLMVNKIESISCHPLSGPLAANGLVITHPGAVRLTLSCRPSNQTSVSHDLNSAAELSDHADHEVESHSMIVTAEKLSLLLSELKEAQRLMNGI